MRRWFLLPILGLFSSSLTAAEWPAAVEKYEQMALSQPGSAEASRQLSDYATQARRVDELAARWESLARGPQEVRYRILLGKLLAADRRVEAARGQLQKATAAAPEDAAAWLALGEFEMDQKTPEAQPALEKARDLGMAQGDPRGAIVLLATDQAAQGHPEQAWETLENGWRQVTAPAVRLGIITRWAEVAASQNRLDEVRGKLEEAWKSGRDSGVELAQFYLSVGDYAEASAVLAPGRKAHPEDSRLRAQSIAVARAAGRTSEVAALLREDAEAAPTFEKWRDLFVAVVENGQADAAREILAAHGEALAATSASWRDLMPRLWQLDLTAPVAKLLAARNDWEANFARAEALLAEGARAEAEPLLWTLFDPQAEAEPLSSSAREGSDDAAPLSTRPNPSSAALNDRYLYLTQVTSGWSSVLAPRRWYRSATRLKLQSLDEARGRAALYLAVIAADADRAEPLVDRLKAAVAAWPLGERVLIWSVVENPGELLRACEEVAALNPPNPILDQFCWLRLAGKFKADSSEGKQVTALNAIFNRSLSGNAQPTVIVSSTQLGAEGLEKPYQAFTSGDFVQARSTFRESMEWRARQPGRALRSYFPSSFVQWLLLQTPKFQNDPAKSLEAAATILEIFCATTLHERPLRTVGQLDLPLSFYVPFANTSGSGLPALVRPEQLPPAIREKLIQPPNQLFNQAEAMTLWRIFSMTRRPEVWAQLKKRLDDSLAGDPPATRRTIQAALAYLAWWNGEFDDATSRMRAILAEDHNPEIGVGLVSMLRKLGRQAEAQTVLDALPRPYPAFQRIVDSWSLFLAAEARDTASAKLLLPGLKDQPLERPALRRIASSLESAGLKEEAAPFRERIDAESAREVDRGQFFAALDDLTHTPDRTGAVNLVKTILGPSPGQADRSEQDGKGLRQKALQVLDQLGERQAFANSIEKAGPPPDDHGEYAVRLAEASGDPDKMRATLQAAQEKQPANSAIARMILDGPGLPAASRRMAFETLLMQEAKETFDRYGGQMTSEYEREGELPRLVEALEKAPFQPRNKWQNTNARDSSWTNLISRLKELRQEPLAIRVALRAMQVTEVAQPEFGQNLVRDLLRLERKEEAAQVLLQTLAPPPASTPILFAMRPGRTPTLARSVDFDSLRLARDLNILPALEARLEQAGASEGTPRATRMWVRFLNRDSTAIPEVDTYLTEAGKSLLANPQWTKKFIETSGSWPEAGALTARVLAGFDQSVERLAEESRYREMLGMAQIVAAQGNKAYPDKVVRTVLEVIQSRGFGREQKPGILRPAAEVADAGGNRELLRACASTLAEAVSKSPETNLNFEDALRILDLASDGGRVKESGQLLAALHQYDGKHPGENLAQQLKIYELESEWNKGEYRASSPIVWLDLEHSTETESSLVWDLGATVEGFDGTRNLVARGGPATPGNGRYTVELLAGAEEGAMESLLRVPDGEIRGCWKGSLPAGAKFVRAVFSDGDRLFPGSPMPIAVGPNRLRIDHGVQWPVAADLIKTVRGGPIPGGEYLSYRPEAGSKVDGHQSVSLGRLKIRPGKDYVISGWLRSGSDQQVLLGWRSYRSQVTQGSGDLRGGYGRGRVWSYSWQRLNNPAGEERDGARYPADTDGIELVVTGGMGGFDAAGLSLVELPDSKSLP